VSMPGTVRGPRHMGHDHTMLAALDPRGGRLEIGHRAALVQAAPPPTASTSVIARTAPQTPPAPTTMSGQRPHRDHQRPIPLEPDVLDRGVLQTHQSTE
jgi:hypothetical protein